MGLKHGLSCHARNCWIEAVKLLQKRQRRPYAICGELANCRSRMLCICWNRKGYVFFLCHWIQQMLMLFLYTRKSAEHARFDAAHELGHLVLHRHGSPQGREAEKEADTFASAFLMP